jgi:transcriptional regulator with XRE-family HTH domain
MKHSIVAMDAQITPDSLSRLLTGESKRPAFQTVVNVAHACGASVGWLLEERGYEFSDEERTKLREAAVIIRNATRYTP